MNVIKKINYIVAKKVCVLGLKLEESEPDCESCTQKKSLKTTMTFANGFFRE
jgi:hypothetical protein